MAEDNLASISEELTVISSTSEAPRAAVASGSRDFSRCRICFEDFKLQEDLDAEDGVQVTSKQIVSLNTCKHVLCYNCLVNAIEANLEDRIFPCLCPLSFACPRLQDDFVLTLLSLESFDKDRHSQLRDHYVHFQKTHERKKKLLNNPRLVECTRCQEVFLPPQELAAALTCVNCKHQFCREHGDGHIGISCSEWYRSEDGRRVRRTEKKMKRLTKPCPHCGIQLHKIEGCDHVVCTNCRKEMCWACGKGYSRPGSHSCPQGCIAVCLQWFLFVSALLLLVVMWVSVGIVLVLVTGCCFCGLCCWKPAETISDGNSEFNWEGWNPRRGSALACALACLPLAERCVSDLVEENFPGLRDGVEDGIGMFFGRLFSIFDVCFRSCFGRNVSRQPREFPVMPVSRATTAHLSKRKRSSDDTAVEHNSDSDNISMMVEQKSEEDDVASA